MLIDGKKIASEIQEEIKSTLVHNSGRKPCLAVIIVGEHPASLIYVSRKTKACEEVGIASQRIALPADTTEQVLLAAIDKLNQDDSVDGILLQLPLPSHLNPLKMTTHILPNKDVDGLHPTNMGKLLIGDLSGFAPCTPLGVKVLLERSKIEVAGKNVLILGRSNLVGKPMAALLLQHSSSGNATVTVAHSKTKNIPELCLQADIIIAAIGQARFVKADMVKQGVVIVDVGINKLEAPHLSKGYEIVGDVDFENVKDKCSYITPVPGGVGPMTIAMLLINTLKSFLNTVRQ